MCDKKRVQEEEEEEEAESAEADDNVNEFRISWHVETKVNRVWECVRSFLVGKNPDRIKYYLVRVCSSVKNT